MREAVSPHGVRLIRFATFEADTRSGELRKSGRKLKLTGQPFQVLTILLERAGEVVSRDDIQKRVWPDTCADVGHNLNTAINKIREVLGDSAENPRFVETLPRRGYRFIAPVNDFEPERKVNAGTAQTLPNVRIAPHRNTRYWWGIAVAMAAIGLLALFLYSRISRSPPVQTAAALPLVTYKGELGGPALSPNAERVAFAWNGGSGNSFSLYEKVVGSEQSLRLTKHAGALDFNPVWSPDGREIAFARIAGKDTGIYIVSSLGGGEREVLSTGWTNTDIYRVALAPDLLDWSPDGKSIVYANSLKGSDISALFLLTLDSMKARQITFPKFDAGDRSPKFSPDGQSIAFIRDAGGAESIYLLPVGGGQERILESDSATKIGIAWAADGKSVVFGGGFGESGLRKIAVAGGSVERLPFGEDGYHPSIRGDRIAYARVSSSIAIWRKDLRSGIPSSEPHNFISSTRIDTAPQFSPDGKMIAFESNRGGTMQVWLCRSDGTGARKLTDLSSDMNGTPRWSPNSRFIAFDSRPEGNSDILVTDVESGKPERFTNSPWNEVVPNWSRDGRWIYFASDRSGEWQVWKKPLAGGSAVQVTHSGGFAAMESTDGKTLYYTKERYTPGLWRISTGGGVESRVLPYPAPGFWGYWAPSNDGIYYLENSNRPQIKFFQASTGKSHEIFDLEGSPTRAVSGLSVSPDGKTILYTQEDEFRSEIFMVWSDQL